MENVTKWWLSLHDNGHIVPGFDSKFGSELFFVVRGTKLQTQNFYKVARTEQWKLPRDWNPCEDRNRTESRYFMRCVERLIDSGLNCSVPWRNITQAGRKVCDTPDEYEVRSYEVIDFGVNYFET